MNTTDQGAEMNATTARLAEMLAANSASATPDDSEMVAGEIGMQPVRTTETVITAAGRTAETVIRMQRATPAARPASMTLAARAAREATNAPGSTVAASEWAQAHPEYCTGRGPTGRLRNFRAMNPSKLLGCYSQVRYEGNDPEALTALRAEVASRGMAV